MRPWRLTSMVSAERHAWCFQEQQVQEGPSHLRFLPFLPWPHRAILTNVLSQNEYFLELTHGYNDGESRVS